MPDFEERVAALEEAMGLTRPSAWPALTEAETAELKEQLAALAEPFTYRVLPPSPPLTPDEIRHLLRECVTIVKPGETLVVRVPWTTRPTQLYEYQRVMDSHDGGEIPFKVLVVAGDELGVVQPEPEAD